MLGLLVQVKPHADESLPGYLHGLAEANGLSGVLVVERFKSEIATGDELNRILPSANPSWLHIARELGAPSTRPMPVWNLRRRRFCGKCLAEKAYRRASWDLSLVTVCSRHRVQLHDACPHCRKPLDWNAHMTAACPACGGVLADDKDGTPAETGQLWLARELTRRPGSSAIRKNRCLAHLKLEELHELAFRLGACASRPNARKPLKIADSASLEIAFSICASGAAMLRDWPSGFSKCLDRIRVERNVQNTWKLAAALGPLYREIFERLPGPAFQFVRDALEKYMLDTWQAPLALRHRRLSVATIATHRWLPVDEAAARLTLSPAIVARVVEVGEVVGRYQKYESGRVACIVDTASLGKVADELRGAMTVEEVAQRFGLSKSRVVRVIDTGLLKVWGGAPRAGAMWFIGKNMVEELLRIGSKAPPVMDMGGDKVSFAHLLRYVAREENAFDAIMTASTNGTIKIVGLLGSGTRICDWVFERKAVNELLNQAKPARATELSIIEAATALAVKQEVAYALVRNGAIKSYERRILGRSARFVQLRDLEAFQRKYVFGSELAKWLARSPKSIVQLLLREGVAPAGGPTIAEGPCRQYYWRRSKKLTTFICKKTGRGPQMAV